jgi:hypothetical protein
MSALRHKEQDAASRVFHHLVTPSGTRIAHAAPDLAEYAELAEGEVESVLDKLSGAKIRILRPVAPPPDHPQMPRYEIFHDVLAPAILDWRARFLRGEIEEHRLKSLYADAQEAIDNRRWSQANENLAKIMEMRPRYEDVAERHKLVREQLQKRKLRVRANAVIVIATTALLGYLSGVWFAERLARRTGQDLALSTMGALAAMSGLWVGAISSAVDGFRVDLLDIRGVGRKHIALRILPILFPWLLSEMMILFIGLVGWGAGALTLWLLKRFTGFYVVVWGWGILAALAALGTAIGVSEVSDPPSGDESQLMEPSLDEDAPHTAEALLERLLERLRHQ